MDFTISSTTTDFYTVPTGKKAMMFSYTINNTSGSSTTVYMAAKISSTYYRVDPTGLTVTNTSYGTRYNTVGFVFSAGESIALVSTQSTSIRSTVFYCEFDATVPIFSAIKYSSWTNGDNTLYTNSSYNGLMCPSFTSNLSIQVINISNSSGASVTYTTYNVPTSGSTSTLYKVDTTTVASGSSSNTGGILHVANGSSIIVNSTSSTDTQVYYITFVGLT